MALAPPVYDDEDKKTNSPGDERMRQLTGIGQHEEDRMDRRAQNGALLNRKALNDAESGSSGGGFFKRGGDGDTSESGKGDSLYRPDADKPSRTSTAKSKIARRSKAKLLVFASGGLMSIVITAIVFFVGGALKLPHIMSNIESKAFARYQVDLSGRSSKWLNAYMELRMGEVEDPKLAPADRDNLIFRSDRVDNNKPLTDWYRTLRASSFESDLYEKYGIKFTSVAYRDGLSIKFRPGLIKVNDETISTGTISLADHPGGDLTESEFNTLSSGDINNLNGRLKNFVEVQTFGSDKEGRQAIKTVLSDEYPHWWSAVKRYHLRHDIQNMVGVRKWSFFEGTRGKIAEKKIDVRNKLIAQAFPNDTRAGRFVKCLFGVDTCKAGSDPANPSNQEPPVPDGVADRDPDKTGTDDPKDPASTLGDGSGEADLSGAADDAVSGAAEGVLVKNIVSKFLGAVGIASMLDSLARFDSALANHSLSKVIAQSKTNQAVGVYSTLESASDQLKSGDIADNSDLNDLMNGLGNPTNSAGWSQVIDGNSTSNSTVSADSTSTTMSPAEADFCSTKHQDAINDGTDKNADNEFQYLCPIFSISSTASTKALEDAWDNGPGIILHPILKLYHDTVGGLVGVFNSITGFVTTPIINGALSALGLSDDIKTVAAWGATQALNYGGGGPIVQHNTPSGQLVNVAIEGGAAASEASMREQGASSTTATTASLATKDYIAYNENQSPGSFAERYLSTSNPQSLVSQQLFAISLFSPRQMFASIPHFFGDAFSSTFKVFGASAHAATNDPYAASNFAGIQTYDFPSQCLDSDPLDATPESETNAVSLGILQASDLNWDMMTNKETWYKAIYASPKVNGNEDIASQVWNCALLDNTVRGGMGALYGYTGNDAYGTSSETGSSDTSAGTAGSGTTASPTAPTAPGTLPSGTAKDLATQLLPDLANGKISCLTAGCPDITNTAKGVSIANGECTATALDPRLLGLFLSLVSDGDTFILSAICSDHGNTGSVGHSAGTAADFNTINGVFMGPDADAQWDAAKTAAGMKLDQDAASVLPKTAGFGQIQCHASFPFLSGYSTFNDTCHHQHISVDGH